jgi:flavin reductase (DIM6/NTAB) family NADH-FMN oxidoreductase RutF
VTAQESDAATPAPELDTTLLRRTLGAFATGVTVVSVGGATPHGMTANSFTAVSLDPPLVLVCVVRTAYMHEALQSTGRFGISVLSAEQEHVARHFANSRRPLGSQQFHVIDSRLGPLCGAPLISGAAANFECELWRTYDGGDHTIFIGRLLSMTNGNDRDVLVFERGKFGRLERESLGGAAAPDGRCPPDGPVGA